MSAKSSALLPVLRSAASVSIHISPVNSTSLLFQAARTRPLKRKWSSPYTNQRPFSVCTRCLANNPQSISTSPASSASQSTDPTQPEYTLKEKIAHTIAVNMPRTTETYYAYRKTEDLYKECRLQGEYNDGEEPSGKAKFWYNDCGIIPTVSSWTSISTLHMWTIMVRFRAMNEKDRAKIWQQHFVNHLFYDLEDLMTNRHKIKSNAMKQRYLKLLNEQFRGAIAAYDEGMIRGDAAFAAAIWRNIFEQSQDVDFEKVALIVSYVRRILSGMENLSERVILEAAVYFGDPNEEQAVVDKFLKETKI